MRESSHSFPGLNRACVVISSQLYDRRAIDSPLPTLPLLTSLQHLAYLTSTSPRIREILTVDGGLERLISIVGGCLDLAFPSAASTSTTGGGSNPRKRTRGGNHSSSPHTREPQQQRKRIVPFKPFVAYANGNIEAAQNWIDTSAVLHTYGFALQCLVNVGVRGSEEVRTRVVEAGVLAVVARILSAFLANRQKERERRLALLEPQKSITLWREGTTTTTTLSGATNAAAEGAARRTHAHSHRSAQHQSGIAMPLSAPASSSSSTASYLQSQQQHPQHQPPISSQQQQQHHIPAQPPTLPPSASRLPSRLLPSSSASSSAASLLLLPSINRTNTPDTVVSVDDLADAESSSGQENELYETDAGQMDIEDETGSATSGEIVSAVTAVAASGSNPVTATTNRSRRGTITTATFVSPEEAAEMMVVKLEDEAAARATSPAVEHQLQEERDMTSSMETPVARSISLQPTTHRQHQQPQQQEDGDGDVVMSQSHPSLAQLHAASFLGSPTNVNDRAASSTAPSEQQLRQGAWDSLNVDRRHQQQGPPSPAAPTALAAPILPFLRLGASAQEARPAPSMSSTSTVRQSATSASTSGTPPSPPLTHLFKEDDVLQCLHLLAYLSKYPHVRAVFHDPENETVRPPDVHPCDVGGGAVGVDDADAAQPAAAAAAAAAGAAVSGSRRAGEHTTATSSSCPRKKQRCGENGEACSNSCARMYQQHRSSGGAAHPSNSGSSQDRRSQDGDDEHMMDDTAGPSTGAGHRQQYRRQAAAAAVAAIAAQNSDDDEDDCDDHDRASHHGHGSTSSYACAQAEAEAAHLRALASIPLKDRKPALEPSRPPRSTANNVFSLVEQFTYRPSGPADRAMRLPTDIQYWAGVIMRNACRKDEQHGGIRQCANMGCGVWEKFPREFAKCRRCRKAKYCSKGCQRRAWQAGHRYWCSARQDSPPQQPNTMNPAQQPNADNVVAVQIANTANGQVMEGVEGEEGIIPTQIRVMEAI